MHRAESDNSVSSSCDIERDAMAATPVKKAIMNLSVAAKFRSPRYHPTEINRN